MSFGDQSGSGSSGFSPAPGMWKDLEVKRGDRTLRQISGCLRLTRQKKHGKKRGGSEIQRPHPHQSPAETMVLSYVKGSRDCEPG